MSNRLLSNQRIKKETAIERVIKQGNFERGRLLNLWCLLRPENAQSRPQLAVIVSRKVDLRATARNLWKRRLREAFRRNQKQIKENAAIVIQAKRKQAPPGYLELEAEFLDLIQRARGRKTV